MNLPTENKPIAMNQSEETLRLLAALPAPQGLEDRVHAALKSAPRTAKVLEWPEGRAVARGWMRGAAAAAIVFVVVGGGWGIASRVQPAAPAKVIAFPRVTTSNGFGSAGAMRTPQTLNATTAAQPETAAIPKAAGRKQAKKLSAKPANPSRRTE